ncbi:MAG: PAS domain S-box protein [Patescibacteria group bacterium]|nr:PAS domain-containing sensor histidine kinase [Patescibacteria group bacterium]MDE2015435.1 PAS domain S-box protein [Patescibacteria group bacterium]MDE2226950.1 PAS domain S-box protein [Patescibacteria group bacterium]
MPNFFNSLFRPKSLSAKEFERLVFSFLIGKISDKNDVAGKINEFANISKSLIPEEQRQKRAADLYFFLENHISNEQPRNRIPIEILREHILNKFHPERAEGNIALIFLSSYERQIKLFELFTEAVFKKIPDLIDEKDRKEIFDLLESDGQLQGTIKDRKFFWAIAEKQVQKLALSEQAAFMQKFLKRALDILSGNLSRIIGEVRTELMFKSAYGELKEMFNFLADTPKVLLIVPEAFLSEERLDLMGKEELEEELRRKKQALEVTLAELQGEKVKLSSLSREELERKAEERTEQLVKALEDVKAGRLKLEEAKATDDAFLENVSDGLVAIDTKWNIILWNKAATAISGWSSEETSGQSLRKFIRFVREDDRVENISFIEDAMLLGKIKRAEHDNVLITKDGTDVAVSVSASPILDDKRKTTSVIVVFRDISKEKELQKTREEFASLATHELRTPVAVMKGYLSLLSDKKAGEITEKQKEYFGKMTHSNDRLLELINAMLNVSRIELGTLAVNPSLTYMPDVADEVISELTPPIKEKRLEIDKKYAENIPKVDLDTGLIHAIFQNLISNAIKYTPADGKIGIRIESDSFDVVTEVADTGYGIPQNAQAKIFGKMFRADNVAEKVPEGTGLGLYIVKSILDQTGGKIWFESEENKGTIFYFSIPLSGMKKKEGIKGLS